MASTREKRRRDYYGEAVGVRRPERCRNEMRFEEREEETRTSPRQTEVEALEGGPGSWVVMVQTDSSQMVKIINDLVGCSCRGVVGVRARIGGRWFDG